MHPDEIFDRLEIEALLTRGRIGGTWRVGAGWGNPVPICRIEHRERQGLTGRSVAVTIRQQGAWPLDPRGSQDDVEGGHHTRRP